MNGSTRSQGPQVSALKERQQVNILKVKLKRIKIVNEDLKNKLKQERTPISNVALNVVDNCRTRPEFFLKSNDNSNITNPYTEKEDLRGSNMNTKSTNTNTYDGGGGCCIIM